MSPSSLRDRILRELYYFLPSPVEITVDEARAGARAAWGSLPAGGDGSLTPDAVIAHCHPCARRVGYPSLAPGTAAQRTLLVLAHDELVVDGYLELHAGGYRLAREHWPEARLPARRAKGWYPHHSGHYVVAW